MPKIFFIFYFFFCFTFFNNSKLKTFAELSVLFSHSSVVKSVCLSLFESPFGIISIGRSIRLLTKAL